jgi:predicted alpha/beta hydrolase
MTAAPVSCPEDEPEDDPESAAVDDGLPVAADDGHHFRLVLRAPAAPLATLLWLPALGVASRHYLPFAEALAAHGVAVFVHEWRGHGSSTLRASRDADWGYRALLQTDLPASVERIRARFPDLPAIVGGHSLGAQLAACLLALQPRAAQRLWIVASGMPYWRTFPGPRAWLLPLAYRFLTWAADRRGALPGRTLGFGGNEARGVMRDWARTGLSGRYAGTGIDRDLETALADVHADVRALLLADDWLAPRASLDLLLAKMRPATVLCATLSADRLGARADHFTWMKRPEAVAAALASGLQPSV